MANFSPSAALGGAVGREAQGGPGKAPGPGRAKRAPRGCSCLADKFYYATDQLAQWGAWGPFLRGE